MSLYEKNIIAEREKFEAWISAPPYEKLTTKVNPDSAWAGQYRYYDVQLAWDAWIARSEICETTATVFS